MKTILGLEKGVVRLVPYTPEWKKYYDQEKNSLQGILGSTVLDIQHVGSTSIAGMPSKPIIDIAIAVADFERARVCIPLIEWLGYEYKGEFGIPRRRYFVKGNPRTFHIHMSEITSDEWQNTLLFRDYLRRHPDLSDEYAELKYELALQYPADREAYLEGKADFIRGIIRLAKGLDGIGRFPDED